MATINVAQFTQQAATGLGALAINNDGLLVGIVSVNQLTALAPGQSVKLDQTSGNILSFVAAAVGDRAIGKVVLDEKSSAPTAGFYIQVATFTGTQTLWLTASGTVNAQDLVEDVATAGSVQTLAAQKQRGISLDFGTNGTLIRVLLFAGTIA